jgi:acyl-CoA thioester hydrolase
MVRHEMTLRVRYSETDQLGTFYNSRALEWFECARTELLRSTGVSYAEMERRGVRLPLIEAAVRYQGRAQYDDLLRLVASAQMCGKASTRFDVQIVLAENGRPVAQGHTVHALTDPAGKPIRPPAWFVEALAEAQPTQTGNG